MEPREYANVVYRKSPRLAWQTVEAETVIIDQSGGRVMGVNEVAGALWNGLDGVRPLEAVVRESVLREFEIDEATALADAVKFIAPLEAAGVVIRVS